MIYIYMRYIYISYIYIYHIQLSENHICFLYVLIYPSAFNQFWDSNGDLTRPILG